MLVIQARLPAEDGAVVVTALQAAADALDESEPAHAGHAPAGVPAPTGHAPAGVPADAGHAPAGVSAHTGHAPAGVSAHTGHAPAGAPAPPGDPDESLGARRADALVVLADSMLAGGPGERSGGERHQVVVHVDAATLVDPRQGDRCALQDGPAVAVDTVRRLGFDATLVALLHGRDGRPLDAGRRTRAISPALRRALRSRDGGCRFPGCTRRRRVDGHHIRHWADGGPTDLDNLALLCRHHYRLVHEGGYRIRAQSPDTLTFTRPDGRPLPTAPPTGPADADDLIAPNRNPGIGPDTLLPTWDGTPPDYDLAVAILLTIDQAPAVPPLQPLATTT
ncbi:hypothetical protein BH20ACT9_BH20ACT9_11670 [soil metagenome]